MSSRRSASGSDDLSFSTDDVAALMQVFKEFIAHQPPRPTAPKIAGLPEDFDPDEYFLHNPDVAAAGMDAAVHSLRHGRFEGRVLKARRLE